MPKHAPHYHSRIPTGHSQHAITKSLVEGVLYFAIAIAVWLVGVLTLAAVAWLAHHLI